MQCIRPLKASFDSQGTITFKPRQAMPGLIGFQLPCGKCLACHLSRAREKGIRAWHEMQSHEESMFLTLTYSDENLKSPYLIKEDHQNFIKRLRKSLNHEIRVVVTGEYGSKNKRPHWHYLIFGHRPKDLIPYRETDFGSTFTSPTIERLWEHRGIHDIGSVTLESASYVARYGAKALGNTDELFKPFHRTPARRALGRSWIEQPNNHKRAFTLGNIILETKDGRTPGKIPRYYVDWAKQNTPELWRHYVTEVRPELEFKAQQKQRKEELDFFTELQHFNHSSGLYPLKKREVEYIILKSKFKELAKSWSL